MAILQILENIANKEILLVFLNEIEKRKKTYVQYCYTHVIKNKARFIGCCSFAENNIIFGLCEITETFKLFYIYLHDKVFFVFSPKNMHVCMLQRKFRTDHSFFFSDKTK